MAFRRKAPPAKQLSTFSQLQLLCNAAAMGLPFQVHNAQALLKKLKVHDNTCLQQFTKNATRQDFFPVRVVAGSDRSKNTANAPVFSLPLPEHYIDPSESSENIVQRVFYHTSSLKGTVETKEESYAPRCGLTGLFFSREEIVDNLQAATEELCFKSPFWIKSDHPALGNFLQLKDGSEAICLSLTAAVIPLGDVEPFHTDLLHPILRKTIGSRGQCFGKDVPLGMNALSGFVTMNPFVQQLPNRGVWISQEQILQKNLQLKTKKGKRVSPASENPFVLVEVERWEMHNADQLIVPGRLALHRSVSQDAEHATVFS